MNGKELEYCIVNSGKSVSHILKATGIKRTTFYAFYGTAQVVEKHYLDKIKEVGIDLNISEQNKTISANQPSMKVLENAIVLMAEMFQLIKEDSQTFKKIVDIAIESKALSITDNPRLKEKMKEF